jgi:predicted DNA-binding transcriptional regulator AlpA
MIYRMEAEKRFPQHVKIGQRAVGWVEQEVAQWVADRIASAGIESEVLRCQP